MIHEFLTNKWILGAVGFIIMFAGVCYLWYQYQVAPYEKQAAETAEFVRQWDKNQQVQPKSSTVERTTVEGLTDSDTPTRVKQITNPTLVTKDIEPTHTQTQPPTGPPQWRMERQPKCVCRRMASAPIQRYPTIIRAI